MKFYGSESEVNLNRNGEREFSAYTWLPLEDIAAQVGAHTALTVPAKLCSDPLSSGSESVGLRAFLSRALV